MVIPPDAHDSMGDTLEMSPYWATAEGTWSGCQDVLDAEEWPDIHVHRMGGR